MRTLMPVQQYMKSFESLKLVAYLCPAKVWTIGYGTTHYPNGQAVQEGDTCSKDMAEVYYAFDITGFEKFLNLRMGEIPLNDYQYSALISLIYNIGTGNFMKSKVHDYLKQKDYTNASLSFMNHVYAFDKIKKKKIQLKGLVIRRKKEMSIFDTPLTTSAGNVLVVKPEIKIGRIENLAIKGLTTIYGMKEQRLVMPKYLDENNFTKPSIIA